MRPSRDHGRGYKSAVRVVTTVVAFVLSATASPLTVATASAQSASAPSADEAQVRALVKSIYAGYNGPIADMQRPPYSPSTAALYKQYDILMKDDPMPALSEFDHYCQCQDFDEKTARLLGVTIVQVTPDLIDATARFITSRGATPNTTRIRFQKTGTWKIHDIFWGEETLRSKLTETIAEQAIAAKAGAPQKSAVTQASVAQNPAPPAPASIAAQPASACGASPRCVEVSSFVATVTDLRESVMNPGSAPLRVVDVTVHFRNKTPGALVLGYVVGSGVVTDDRGNRYTLGTYSASGVRGMGVLNNSGVIDPKFALRGGESGDARFEFLWQSPPSTAIFGTRLVVELAVREIESLAGDQWKLGREYALQFRNFSESGVSAAATAATPAPTSPAASSPVDVCAGRPECYSAGPFLAEITRLSTSDGPARQKDIQFSVRFRNLTGQPLVLGHTAQSVSVVDDQGNRYSPRYEITEVSGMGRANGMQSDPSFILRPGATGDATYQVRFGPPTGTVRYGTTYNVDFAVEQLELLPGNQVRSARQFAVGFHDVKAKSGGWNALRGLLNIEIKTKK